jgi:hypothetical protein
VDAGTGQIVPAALTGKEVDDATQFGLLFDQITGSLGSVTADGAYEQDGVYAEVADCGNGAAAPRSRRQSGDGNGRLVNGDGASEGGRAHVWTNVGRAKSTLVGVLNRMVELGRPNYVQIVRPQTGMYRCVRTSDLSTTLNHAAIAELAGDPWLAQERRPAGREGRRGSAAAYRA